MARLFKLIQGAGTLADFVDTTNYGLREWRLRALGSRFTTSTLRVDMVGSTNTDLMDNVIALSRALYNARENYKAWRAGLSYTPIYLQWQETGATLLQSECFGLESGDGDEWVLLQYPDAILSNRLRDIPLTILHRGYFEETSAQSLYTTPAVGNDGTGVAISGARGDLPAPLYVKCRTSIASQDRIIAGTKWHGTVANFVSLYEAESYSQRGSNVADLTVGATFSGAGVDGQRWTPGGAASEQRLVLWRITTNVVDQIGTYALYARVRDNAATPKIRIRARGGRWDGTNYDWNEYADNAKYCVTANGTIELVYCGVITLEADSITPNGFAIEIRSTADSGAGTFDIDCLYLIPVEGAGDYPGGGVATMTTDAGTAALPDLVLDGNDRFPQGYLETTASAILSRAQDIRGGGIFILPNTSAKLYVLTQDSGTGAHDFTGSNTLTVSCTPRFRIARGS